MIQFDLPKNQSSIIKVIGVGGGGSNAVNHMHQQNIEGVDFIICNTDAQALALSAVPNKIQLGPQLTSGLGAGANPEVGKQATEESLEEIKKILEVNTKMAFVTAGMGGGTGTGGAPILSRLCKEMGILTVGIVTTPFEYEGKKRLAQAEAGIAQMKDHVDTLLVISNDKVRHQYGNLKVKEAFAKADNVLATAAKCITDVINHTGQINVDFADVCTVMKNGGVAILGAATASGPNRALEAIENALNSPLLNDNDIHGAKWVLININSAEGEHEYTMDEVDEIQRYLHKKTGANSDVILGLGTDNTLDDHIGVTLIATGFEHKDPFVIAPEIKTEAPVERIVMELNMPNAAPATPATFTQVQEPAQDLNIAPAYTAPEFDFTAVQPPPSMPMEVSSHTEEKLVFDLSIEPTNTPINPEPVANISEQEDTFLRKPSQIYQEPTAQKTVVEPQQEDTGFRLTIKEEPPVNMPEMKLVEVNEHEQPIVRQTITTTVMPDRSITEDEDLRNRAMERLNRLRSLSYNIDGSDPNNEFETIPAYVRRNMQVQNQIADVESFYSNFSVKSDENNNVEISSINQYLDGKKPD